MKKILFLAVALVLGASALTSCSDKDDDKDLYVTVDFEGSAYATLIDTVQYGGPLIYSGTPYKWTDAASNLSGELVKADWTAYGMGYGWDSGFAISNYVDNSADASYDKQLAVPQSNGSKQFAVCYGDGSAIAFADGSAHVVNSMMVSPNTYCLNDMKKAANSSYEFKAVATGTKADGTTSTLDIVLAKGTDVKDNWFTVDMSALGAVKSIAFSFDGTDKGSWGLNTPKYLAVDNIVIVK